MYLGASVTLLLCSLQHVAAVWPAPQSYTHGSKALWLDQAKVKITYNGGNVPYTHGFEPTKLDSKQVVQGGVSRAMAAIFTNNIVPWKLHKRNELAKIEPDGSSKEYITCLDITQTGKDTESTFKPKAGDVDESYTLTVSKGGEAKLNATSAIGVLRGLETFSQLFYEHSRQPGHVYLTNAPIEIKDKPKFQHRGLLLDVARNWFAVDDILRAISGLSYNKFNRIHIHITDAQSWPLVIPALPELAEKGAYRSDLVYTPADLAKIQLYGAVRGVEVIIETDMPGHISSVAEAYPDLITAYDAFPYYWWCAEPPCGAFKLNNTDVDKFVETMFDDLLPRVSQYSAYYHTGGDELNANDSMLDPALKTNSSEVLQPLLQDFIDKAHGHVRKAGMTPMVWEEIPIDWSVKLGDDVVVQTWLGEASVKNVTGQGYKVIDSNYNYWYLDCGRGQWLSFENGAAVETYFPFNDWCGPTKSWQLVYSYDPTAGLTEKEAKLVLGGEVALWSETVDTNNMDSLLWPRSSAAGEVLWSGRQDASGQNRSQLEAAPRLNEWRERMVARGIRSAPVQMIWCSQADNATECSYPVV